MNKELQNQLAAIEIYQHALKRIARILERAEDGMVRNHCYWRIRSECNDLIVSVKMKRVGALFEMSNIRKGA